MSGGSRRSTGGFPDVHEVECGSFGSVSVVVGWVGLVGERSVVAGIALRRSEKGSSDVLAEETGEREVSWVGVREGVGGCEGQMGL